MRRFHRFSSGVASLVLAATCFALAPRPAQAQFLDRLKDRAEDAAEQETLNQIDRMVRDKVKCVFNDLECMQGAQDSGEEYVLTDENGEVLVDEEGQPVSDPERAGEMMEGGGGPPDLSTMETGNAPGLDETDANYDFEPGDRVLFADDYADDNVGDFPRSMDLLSGSWDVVEWDGRRWLRNIGPRYAALAIPLPETLPGMFTIEFDAYFPHPNHQLLVATNVPEGRLNWRSIEGNAFRVGVLGPRTGLISPRGDGVESMTSSTELQEGPVPVRIMVDDQYAKMFVGARRIANVPNAVFARSDRLMLMNLYNADDENPLLIGPIRIAAGGRDLYDVLEREGRFTARGILFDVNSANLRAESADALEEIGRTLEEHSDLRLSIEGHTDSDGDEAHNLALSEARANAVRNYLIERFDVDASRLSAEGFGETVPVAPNETEEGKQQNRRVELVRL